MAASVVPGLNAEPHIVNRCLQICSGIVAMMAVANLQNVWTLFTQSLAVSLNTTLAVVQVAFATFILAEIWLAPMSGPRAMVAFRNRSRIGVQGGKRHG